MNKKTNYENWNSFLYLYFTIRARVIGAAHFRRTLSLIVVIKKRDVVKLFELLFDFFFFNFSN